jgi:hypothetical protein
MKQILLILFLFVLAFSVKAQDEHYEDVYYDQYIGQAEDTITSNQATWNYWFNSGKRTKFYYNIAVLLDSTDTPDMNIKLQERDFTFESWSDVTSVDWSGTSSDTTIYLTDESTGVLHRQLRVLVTRTSGSAKIDDIYFEFKNHE